MDFDAPSDLSDEAEYSESPSKKEKEEDDFTEPVKKAAKPKTAPEPKASKPKAKPKTTAASSSKASTAAPEARKPAVAKGAGLLGPKLKLPPPRRCGLSRRAVFT